MHYKLFTLIIFFGYYTSLSLCAEINFAAHNPKNILGVTCSEETIQHLLGNITLRVIKKETPQQTLSRSSSPRPPRPSIGMRRTQSSNL